MLMMLLTHWSFYVYYNRPMCLTYKKISDVLLRMYILHLNVKKSCECYLSNINLNYRFFAHSAKEKKERLKLIWQTVFLLWMLQLSGVPCLYVVHSFIHVKNVESSRIFFTCSNLNLADLFHHFFSSTKLMWLLNLSLIYKYSFM